MTHQLKGGGMSNGLTNNNYYAFTPPTSASNSPSSSNNNDLGTTAEQELAGGGLSFVIHSPNKNQQQIGSISSVASSASSGISSGSSTITKNSSFNGNTFTRSKPKERKPLPNTWQQQQERDAQDRDHHHHQHDPPEEATAAGDEDAPFKGKGLFPVVIPTVTLSEATPPKKKSSSSVESPSSPLFYFNSDSSAESVVRPKRKSSSFSGSDHDHSAINFKPGACSTFILAEGEEFPGERRVGAGGGGRGGASGSKASGRNDIGRNSIGGADKCAINNGDVTASSSSSGSNSTSVFSIPGNTKMKAEKSATVTEAQLSSASGTGASASTTAAESPNGSSSGIHSNFSGEEENFECFGEGSESFTFQESCNGSGDTSLQYSKDGADLDQNISSLLTTAGGGGTSALSRNSWTRTSLRKSPQNNGEAMGYRRWGSFRNAPGTKRTPPVVTSSNALANQLYRSSSFHSSGRSSAGDAEEMYSDGSLEDEVIDLTHKVHHLEEKMNVLAENQNDADDRFTREKEKNAELSTKVFMLEEQLRETELRGEEKLREEQRRFKEFQSRCDREKQLQSENYEIRVHSMEKDLALSKTEGQRLKNQLERERSEKELLSDKLMELERELGLVREENRALIEQGRRDREQMTLESAGSKQALVELKKELENMRQFQIQNSPTSLRSLRHDESAIEDELMETQELKSRVKEYEEEIKKLRKINKQLQDANDELNAQLLNRGLEEGRTLLTTINSVPAGDSLAAEFEAMSQDQTALGLYVDSETDLAKVKKALQEQVDVNIQLRDYIDGILLIIVENNPQLLEVKNNGGFNGDSNRQNTNSSNATNGTVPKCQPPSPNQEQKPANTRINFSNGLSKISFRK